MLPDCQSWSMVSGCGMWEHKQNARGRERFFSQPGVGRRADAEVARVRHAHEVLGDVGAGRR